MTADELIRSIWSRRKGDMVSLTRKQSDWLCALCKRDLGKNLYPVDAFFLTEIDGCTVNVMKNRLYLHSDKLGAN